MCHFRADKRRPSIARRDFALPKFVATIGLRRALLSAQRPGKSGFSRLAPAEELRDKLCVLRSEIDELREEVVETITPERKSEWLRLQR